MPICIKLWEDQETKDSSLISPPEPNPEAYSTDYHNRCGHCHEYIGEDRYCRYCGTKRGQGEYKPYLDLMQCIYGPMPIERTHKCTRCGNEYTVVSMLDNERYCPLCGGKTTIISTEKDTPECGGGAPPLPDIGGFDLW